MRIPVNLDSLGRSFGLMFSVSIRTSFIKLKERGRGGGEVEGTAQNKN